MITRDEVEITLDAVEHYGDRDALLMVREWIYQEWPRIPKAMEDRLWATVKQVRRGGRSGDLHDALGEVFGEIGGRVWHADEVAIGQTAPLVLDLEIRRLEAEGAWVLWGDLGFCDLCGLPARDLFHLRIDDESIQACLDCQAKLWSKP